jgi:Uma2 family endonuclease
MNPSGLFQWTKRQFRSAAAAGWFADRKVELLGGIVYTMTPNPPHITATLNLEDLFKDLMPQAQWFIAREITIEMGSWMPIPDIAVVRGPRDHYKQQLPTHGDVALIVEVSDTTYAKDRGKKYRRDAKRQVPVYWIVDLDRSLVEVHANPSPRRYRKCETFTTGDSVPVVIDGQTTGVFLVSRILPCPGDSSPPLPERKGRTLLARGRSEGWPRRSP